jgi:tetratricopeptide (TPR) repeat protein
MNDLAAEYFRKAFERQQAGRFEEAVILYKKSIQEEPSAEAHTFLGWAYSFQGRYEEAIAECKKAIEVDPDFGNPYNDIGAYLVELGRPDEAVEWLERAIGARRYEPRHFPHFNLARILARRHDWGPAIEHLRRAVELEPRYAVARRELEKLLARMN